MCLKECSDETLSIFWKNACGKNQEILKWKNWKFFFFYFQPSVFLIFVKIWTPVFTFYFWLINIWRKWWTYVLRKLAIKCMIVFQVSINFDPVKKILKILCHIYISMKKVIILRKTYVTMKSFTLTISTIERN